MPEHQKVFDTIAGPNLRVRDNLIQFVCVIVGGVAGGGIGRLLGSRSTLVVGVALGLLLSLLVSGAIIGVIRHRDAKRK